MTVIVNRILSSTKQFFTNEIEFSKHSGYAGVLLPAYNKEHDEIIFLENIYQTYDLEEMAQEFSSSEQFVLIDFTSNQEQVIRLDN